LGAVYEIKRDWKAAETAYRKALEVQPEFLRARVALTSLYLAMGNEDRAEDELIVATKAEPENEQLLHILGDFYSRTRRPDDYEKLYRDLLQRKPESIVAKKRIVEILIMKGDLKKANAYIEEILKGHPDDTDGHYFRGRLHLAERNYQKARDELSLVTRKEPKFAPAFYHLALAQIGLNQMRQATSFLLKAAELNPVWLVPRLTLAQTYLTSGDYELAWRESERILRVLPENRPALLIGSAARLRKGDQKKALELLKKAKELNPQDSIPYINIGGIYLFQKMYPLALKEYEQALKLDPDRIEALRSIASILVLQGNRRAAFERTEKHTTKTKNQAEVYQLLGELSLEAQDRAVGMQYLKRAVELNPELFSAYFLIAQAYVGEKKFDEASKEYQKILAKNPNSIPALTILGILNDQNRQHAKANEYYQKALDVDRNFAPAANNLAWNYAEHGGNLDRALALAQKAREISPESPHIADTLGWIYYKKGLFDSAVTLLRESSEKLQNNNPAVLYHLGMVYQRKGQRVLARETLNRALGISKAFPGAEEAEKTLSEIESPKPK
jgi:tetratricopeptide (TPR) repeat protein